VVILVGDAGWGDSMKLTEPRLGRGALVRAALTAGAASITVPGTLPATAATVSSVPALALTGGGNFLWWQLGAVDWLSSHFDLSGAQFVGASAGALSGTLAACDVSPQAAYESCARLNRENGFWDPDPRSGFARDFAGGTYAWLEELLPADARTRCNGRLHISVTQVEPPPGFGTRTVSDYRDRADLINANMASVHIPYLFGGTFAASFRGHPCIDGSVYLPNVSDLSKISQPPYLLPDGSQPGVRVCHADDSRIGTSYNEVKDFVKAGLSPREVEQLMEWGSSHFAALDAKGKLCALESLRRA